MPTIVLEKKGLDGDNLAFVTGLENSINEALKSVSSGVTTEEVADIISKHDFTSVEGFREIKRAIEDQGLTIQGLKENGAVYKEKSIGDILREKAEELKGVKEKAGPLSFEIELKEPATIMTTTHITPQPNPYLPAPTILSGINRLPQTEQVITRYITNGTTSRPRVVWVNEVNGEGDAEFVAEGALKPLVDFDFTTEDESAKKVAAVAKVSEEMLEDIEWMEGEIRRLLSNKVTRKINTAVLNADGTGVNLNGILNRVGGYTQTCLNGSVTDPGLEEVLLAAATQIRSLGFTGRLIAFVNSCDYAASRMRKDKNGNILNLDGLLDGITVVETPEIEKGNFLIGDMSYFILEWYKALRVEIGWENDDFRRNLRTIIAEARVLLRISSNNLGAFVYDTIANVQTLIAATETETTE